MKDSKSILPNFWISKNREKISCEEKIKVLNNNLDDLKNLLEDTYDEAILMGVAPKQIKEVLYNLLKNLNSTLDIEK